MMCFIFLDQQLLLVLDFRSVAPSGHGHGLGKEKVGSCNTIGAVMVGYTYAETRCPPTFILECVVT
jgi:hypothetical protein